MADYWRNLPHFHPEQRYLFVTWRLHGTLPAEKSTIKHATPGQAFAAADRALDRSQGPRLLAEPRIANLVAEVLLIGEQEKHLYELNAWAIMPNHVHVLILPSVPLAQITQWIKGRTARELNLLLGRQGGPFWQHESYDHWVRNQRELNSIAAYIENNPVAAGLAKTPEDWPWSSAGHEKLITAS